MNSLKRKRMKKLKKKKKKKKKDPRRRRISNQGSIRISATEIYLEFFLWLWFFATVTVLPVVHISWYSRSLGWKWMERKKGLFFMIVNSRIEVEKREREKMKKKRSLKKLKMHKKEDDDDSFFSSESLSCPTYYYHT